MVVHFLCPRGMKKNDKTFLPCKSHDENDECLDANFVDVRPSEV